MDVQPSPAAFIKLLGDNQANNIPELQPIASNNKIVNQENFNLGYLVNLEQPNGTSQVVQLSQSQAVALGILPNGSKDNTPIENIKLNQIKVNNVESKKDEVIIFKPLGSCDNPIEIIKEGELLHSTQNLSPEYLQQIAQALQLDVKREEEKEILENAPPNIFYRVVYPDELNLKPLPTKPLKRGRRKKQPPTEEKLDVKEIIHPPKVVKGFRTRSGRVTRPPQHIKNDFRKIDTSQGDSMDMEDLRTTDFESPTIEEEPDFVHEDRLETHKRKRSISSQFRCPQCKKAYLGNNRMLQHFEKHPDHRPSSDYYKARYDDTWNYLIDISNKNPAGQRGLKFCRELVSLLNNIKIVAKSFFKNPTDLDKNLFFVDSTLSNVLGIDSGNYVLNESKLHKEVQTLLPCSSNAVDNNNIKPNTSFGLNDCQTFEKDLTVVSPFNQNNSNYSLQANLSSSVANENVLHFNNPDHNGYNLNCDITSKSFDSQMHTFNEPFQNVKQKDNETIRITIKPERLHKTSQLSLHNDLLSDSTLLHSLPNLRSSVEELILHNVDNAQCSVMLDNSTSSDEVMNVDQFVSERLKNLTESDLELPNPLNLDLPSLDLFQFHTS